MQVYILFTLLLAASLQAVSITELYQLLFTYRKLIYTQSCNSLNK